MILCAPEWSYLPRGSTCSFGLFVLLIEGFIADMSLLILRPASRCLNVRVDFPQGSSLVLLFTNQK